MPVDLIQLLALLGMLFGPKSSKLGALGMVNEGLSMIYQNKTGCFNSRRKEGEMHKVTEYAKKFKQDQNIFKVPNKESISIIYGGKKPKKPLPVS